MLCLQKSMYAAHRRILFFLTSAAAAVVPVALWANVTGADPRLTAAPGESGAACTACHSGTRLNAGSGSVKIVLPGDATYVPGVTQHITVQLSDPTQRRWGFELSARLASNPSSSQAGDLSPTDNFTQVICSNGRRTPCNSSSPVQFITHTLSGTRNGTNGGVSFEFDWMPPSSDVGTVTLYAAGNAANGNNNESGDHIYTTSIDLNPAATQSRPTISDSGVVNGASFQPGIMQNSWITIKGTNLGTTTRTWSDSDFSNGNLPTSLDNVSVTVNGKPAYVEYVSPTQINALTPADDSVGAVQVQVTVNGQTSDAFTTDLNSFSPAFFTFDGHYAAATHANNKYLGKPGLFASAPNLTTPAQPGETVVLYGTGFGSTSPDFPNGQLPGSVSLLNTPFTVTVGGIPANVTFAGLLPNFAGLYQMNIEVPGSVPNGDQPVVLQIGGVTSTAVYITVQQ